MHSQFNHRRTFIISLLFSILYSNQLFADTLYTVNNAESEQMVQLDATVEAIDKATLSSQTTGRIIKINFDNNDYVRKGEVLLEITNKEQGAQLAASEAQLLSAKASYNEAQLTYARYKKLFPKGAISQGQLDQAEATANTTQQQIKAAQANLIQAKESLNYTIVKAPFSGVVTERHVEVGETVNLGEPLFSGMSLDNLRVVSEIPQRYLNVLRDNPSFIVTLPDGSQLYSDKITLFSYADQQSHAFKIRINLPKTDKLLLPGMWVKAQFSSGKRSSILIPNSAVLTNNELTAVYRNVNGKAILTQVRLGNKSGDFVEVLAGLQSGDKISVDAYQQLQSLEPQ
ncbi:efflux RND transporter periplasmic adaptor subunit [Psychromonas sp. psych-6C06]|uniref:efflux RND transporter periplasmic adaptor subunit n=1 Tax=Psychromonas sp. psych-6C06 TaxID=2058089 RepID=UPI000C34A15C|nr:efflux RND transporter periplasmic adaptor subunit [Psychromonas sp. psych-6C06]PKF62857.1 efflux RND transporter periplasmic adaptor subunit [Psychromonas sp. psych-6C06]